MKQNSNENMKKIEEGHNAACSRRWLDIRRLEWRVFFMGAGNKSPPVQPKLVIKHRIWGCQLSEGKQGAGLGFLRFVCYNMGDSARVLIFYVLASGMPGQLREQHQVDVANVADLAVRKASEDEWQIFFISKVRVTHVTS